MKELSAKRRVFLDGWSNEVCPSFKGQPKSWTAPVDKCKTSTQSLVEFRISRLVLKLMSARTKWARQNRSPSLWSASASDPLEKQWAGSKGSEKGHPHPREVFYTHKVLCPHLSLYLLCLITWDFFGNTPTRKYLRETTLQRKWTLHFGPTQKPFEQIWTQTCLNHGNVTYAASQNGKRKCSWR